MSATLNKLLSIADVKVLRLLVKSCKPANSQMRRRLDGFRGLVMLLPENFVLSNKSIESFVLAKG